MKKKNFVSMIRGLLVEYFLPSACACACSPSGMPLTKES